MTDLNNPLRTAEYPTLRATVTTATTAVNTNPFPAGCQGFMVVATVSAFIEISAVTGGASATVTSIPIPANTPMYFSLPDINSQNYRISCANLIAVLGTGTPVAGDILIRPMQRN